MAGFTADRGDVVTAPMQRAINAAVKAINNAPNFHDTEHYVRIVIEAAYPHLFQSLAKQNRELRTENTRLNNMLSPKQ